MMNGALYQNHHLTVCVGLCRKHDVLFMTLGLSALLCEG